MTDTNTWTNAQLKEYFDEQLRQRDLRYQLQFKHDQEAVEKAAAALEDKLHGMNEFRAALSDTTNRCITREEAESRICALSDRFDATLAPLHEKIDSSRKPNWTLVSVLASVAVAAIAGIWMVIGLQISNAETPIALNVSQLKEQNAAQSRTYADNMTQTTNQINSLNERQHATEERLNGSQIADEQSRTDRAQLNQRVHELEAALTSADAERRANAAAMSEIETQFCAADQVRNLMHANDLRIESMLWAKVYPGQEYPTGNAYYPTICRGGSVGSKG